MDQNTHLDRLTELTIIHRAQLKELVQQLPAIREELRAQIEKRIEQTEPEIRRELESFVTAKTDEEMLRAIAHFDKQIRDAIDATDRLANEKIMSLMAEKKAIAELIKKAQIDAETSFEELTAEVKKLIEAGGKELAEETNRQKLFLLQENKTINPRGQWDETETYEKLDLVTYNGSSFVANETIPPGTKPTFKSPYWTLIARRGGGGGIAVTSLPEIVGSPEDGQLLIGDNGNFTKAFLTAGTGVTITNSAGGIEISAPENGTVVGPASATDNAITRFDGTTGDLIQNSGITLDDANSVANVAQIEFDTSATPTAPQGAIYWNGEDHHQTLIVQSNGVPLNVGQDVVYRVKASAPITKGQVVMFTGAVGNSGGITAAPATGLAFNQGNLIIGVAAESMNTNDWGIVAEFGYIRQINTTGGGENWIAGQVLYFNPSVAGGLTKVKPTAPAVKLEIAAVTVVSATVGEILVRVGTSTVLGETESNVEIGSPANNDFLVYDTGDARWENKTAADSRTALGLGTIATQDADSVDITGGSIDATAIGAVTASTGAFTSLTSSSTTTLNGTTIPASSTLVTTTRQISSGTGLSGGGDLSADRTISLADTTVTAAAYGSATQVATFTVDAQGRLTAAASVTATPAFSSIQSTPTTLSGYGITDAVNTSALGAANGVATLDSSSKLTASQIPDIAVTDYLGASADQAAMLALTGQKGDWTTRTDLGTVWVITGNDPTQLADWTQLSYPTAPVTSVAGKTGAVTLVSSDVGLGNVTNDAQLKIASNLSDVNDAATARSNLGAGTVNSVDLGAGTGISLSGGPITASGVITVTNTAPDQTVVLSDGTGITTSGTYPNFTITNSAPDQTVSLTAGTSITISGTYPAFTITNTDPDQTVVLNDGTGITTSGTYPNFTITNSAPDETVVLTAGTSITISGTYPAFTITNTDPDQTVVLSDGTGISTSGTYPNFTITNTAPDQTVALTAGTSISISGSYPAFTITNTDPDQTVVLSDGTGISTSGTYPNFTITNSAPDQTVSIAAGTGISVTGTYPSFTVTNSLPSLGGDVVGPASSTDNGIVRFDGTTGKLVQDSSSVVIDDSGNVGIGTTSPSAKLDVNGNLSATGTAHQLEIGTGTFTISRAGVASTVFSYGNGRTNIISSTSGIMVGADSLTDATTKSFKFGAPHYSTNAEEPTGIFFNNTPSANVIAIGGGTGSFNAPTEVAIYAAANNTTTTGTKIVSVTSTGLAVTGALSSTTGANFATSSGNVGIGTTAPGAKLEVVPGTAGVTAIGGTNFNLGERILVTSGRSGHTVQVANDFLDGAAGNGAYVALFPFDDSANSDDKSWKAFRLMTESTLVDKFWVNKYGEGYFSGNVGIGTTSPSAKLDVNGNVATAGNLSVGISTPTWTVAGFSTIEARGSTSAGLIGVSTAIADADGAQLGQFYFADRNTTSGLAAVARIIGYQSGTTANNRGSRLVFSTKADGGSLTDRLSILANGNVGIGTTSPSAKLHVVGQFIGGGTTTNDNASAGQIGEYVEGNLSNASKVTLTSGVAANTVSISLTAGDWDVSGVCYWQVSGSTPTGYYATITSSSATLGSSNTGENFQFGQGVATASQVIGSGIPPTRRFSLSTTTTIYLVAYADFPSGTTYAYGTLRARRAR